MNGGAYIPNLSTTPSLDGGYYFLVAKGNSNNAQRASAELVASFVGETLDVNGITTEYAAPSATAFNVELPDTSDDLWLILTPTAGFAAGTITLPESTAAEDQQTVDVNCTQAVTTLTVAGNGATVTGAPTTLAANAFFRLRYDAVTSTWYRIG